MGRAIEIPEEWHEKFEERAPDKGFESAEEYVHYVLQQIYEKLQQQEQDEEDKSAQRYSEEEERKVKERLRGLGYLD